MTTMAFGVVGLVDDYKKLVLQDSRGLAARWKYLWQSVFRFSAAVALYSGSALPAETQLILPFFKHIVFSNKILHGVPF